MISFSSCISCNGVAYNYMQFFLIRPQCQTYSHKIAESKNFGQISSLVLCLNSSIFLPPLHG